MRCTANPSIFTSLPGVLAVARDPGDDPVAIGVLVVDLVVEVGERLERVGKGRPGAFDVGRRARERRRIVVDEAGAQELVDNLDIASIDTRQPALDHGLVLLSVLISRHRPSEYQPPHTAAKPRAFLPQLSMARASRTG